MKNIFLLSLVIAPFLVAAHDINVAYFNLFENTHLLELDMEFEKGDLLEAATAYTQQKASSTAEQHQLIKKYLLAHIYIKINHKEAPLKILSIKEAGHHIFIKAQIKKEKPTIKRIDFATNCLVKQNPDQHNVLVADVNCKTRGFRLSSKRLSVLLEY